MLRYVECVFGDSREVAATSNAEPVAENRPSADRFANAVLQKVAASTRRTEGKEMSHLLANSSVLGERSNARIKRTQFDSSGGLKGTIRVQNVILLSYVENIVVLVFGNVS